MTDFTMLVRYAMMMATGVLLSKGYIDSSVVEPLIGVGIAVAGFVWKKLEAKINPGV
jgi:hypothetical protein